FVSWLWVSCTSRARNERAVSAMVYTMGSFAMSRAFLVSVLCLAGSAHGGFFAPSDVQRGQRVPQGTVQRITRRPVAHAHLSPEWVKLAQEKVRRSMENADLRGAQGRDATTSDTTPTPSVVKDAHTTEAAAAIISQTTRKTETDTSKESSCVIPRDQQQQTREDKKGDAKIVQRFRMLSAGLGRAFTPGSLSPVDRMKKGTLEPVTPDEAKNMIKVTAAARAGAKMRGG
ncbi:unnamed protein product, partial [Laminaria digitata]